MELVADLCEFWYASSFGRDAAAWIARAMRTLEEAALFDRARLLVGNAAVLLEQGDADWAGPSLAQGLELLRVVGDPLYTSRALILRAAELIAKGRFAEAEAPLLEALSLAETVPDALLRASAAGRALTNLCCAARGQGDFERATDYGEAALRLL